MRGFDLGFVGRGRRKTQAGVFVQAIARIQRHAAPARRFRCLESRATIPASRCRSRSRRSPRPTRPSSARAPCAPAPPRPISRSSPCGSRSMRKTCCRAVCVQPARKRLFVGVTRPRTRDQARSLRALAPEIFDQCVSRCVIAQRRDGRTRAPRSTRLLAAFAPPPGSVCVSRCRKISTGASRETREISPETNSSATKSPSSKIVCRENCSTRSIRRARSAVELAAE